MFSARGCRHVLLNLLHITPHLWTRYADPADLCDGELPREHALPVHKAYTYHGHPISGCRLPLLALDISSQIFSPSSPHICTAAGKTTKRHHGYADVALTMHRAGAPSNSICPCLSGVTTAHGDLRSSRDEPTRRYLVLPIISSGSFLSSHMTSTKTACKLFSISYGDHSPSGPIALL